MDGLFYSTRQTPMHLDTATLLAAALPASSSASATNTFIAGAVARVGRDLVLHPFDTVKTRKQTALETPLSPQSLYAGILPVILCGIPAGGAYFSLNQYVLDAFPGATIGAAAVAAVGMWALRTPGEVIKTRAQAEIGGILPASERIAALIKDGGVGALWLGLPATLVRSVPFEVLRLSVYTATRSVEQISGDAALCGFIAGLLAALLTQPLDAVKTRKQTEASDGMSNVLGPLGVLRSAREMVEEAGTPAALFSGWSARATSASLSSAVLFGIYQALLEVLDAR